MSSLPSEDSRWSANRGPRFSPWLTPQRLLIGGLIFTLLLAGARFLSIQGWVRPVRIVSGSMADRLIGENYVVTCADCEFVFRFGVESPPPTDRAVCPNCGYGRNIPRAEWRTRGERVMIDRGAYLFERPRRFDLVAFRDPRLPVRLVVKRVIGLPGETVSIQAGDIYLDGRILRKSLNEFSRSAILVHDHSHSPNPKRLLPSRWRSALEISGWAWDGKVMRFTPPSPAPTSDDAVRDVLTYHHWRCYANMYPRAAEAPVSDHYGYNQGESRELREVSDIIVVFQMKSIPDGKTTLRVHDGREWSTATIDWPHRRVEFFYGRQSPTVAPIEVETPDGMTVEFGVFDQQIVLGFDGDEVIRHPYERTDATFDPITEPISIESEGSLAISNLQVRRDVYYLDPWAVGQKWSMNRPLGPDEYLVLGDNPPISDDSRKWKEPGLARDRILGRVIPLPR